MFQAFDRTTRLVQDLWELEELRFKTSFVNHNKFVGGGST